MPSLNSPFKRDSLKRRLPAITSSGMVTASVHAVQSHAGAWMAGLYRSHVTALLLTPVVMPGDTHGSNGRSPRSDMNVRDLPNKKRPSPPASGHCQVEFGGQELKY